MDLGPPRSSISRRNLHATAIGPSLIELRTFNWCYLTDPGWRGFLICSIIATVPAVIRIWPRRSHRTRRLSVLWWTQSVESGMATTKRTFRSTLFDNASRRSWDLKMVS
ncbi:hypothetical protein GQ53DRAFT_239127 [Thozetella sp. PMI_491]|nr:hypothetical protein GQ53DRAFT_239127 [Thozetella sp. PMI_491]